MMHVVAIGECMVELRAGDADSYRRGFAGDAYNTAVYLRRSAADARVSFLTATGDDALSAAMRAAWRAEGIDDALADTVPGGVPGLYLIETDAAGERRFTYWRSASAARRWPDALERHLAAGSLAQAHLYVSGISFAILPQPDRERALEMLLTSGNPIAFDPNLRLALWDDLAAARALFEAMARHDAIILPSAEDMDSLYGPAPPRDHLDRIRALGAREIALTLGADGCLLGDGTRLDPPRIARAADTSGAGDSFNGAYLAARWGGATPYSATEAGMALAAHVVTFPGAIIPRSAQSEIA